MSKFIICLWSGSGYGLDAFEVEATSEMHALDLVVTQIVNEGKTNYFEEEGSDYITELKMSLTTIRKEIRKAGCTGMLRWKAQAAPFTSILKI